MEKRMLKMDKVYVIRYKVLIEGLSQREVARQLNIDKETVAKYLKEAEPKRVEKKAREKPVTEKVGERIDELLVEWGRKTTAKQRITSTIIHKQLIEEGYIVGKTTIKRYLREKKRETKEVYIPLVYRAGEVAQVDYFEVAVKIKEEEKKVWKFLMRLQYSGYEYIWLYEKCDQLSLLDGHVRAFKALGGIPQRIVYDNLSLAVKKVLGGERELTDKFKSLVSHYLYEPCFTRVGEGHDKGGVEQAGKNIRLQHMTPIPQADSLKQISEEIQNQIKTSYHKKLNAERISVAKAFEEEKKYLKALPEREFDPRVMVMCKVSNKALVRIEGADYAVPQTWARLDAKAYIGVEEITVACKGTEIILPKQVPGSRYIRYRNYLPELARKPQAVRQVAPNLVTELGEPFPQLWEMLSSVYGGREAGRVLSRILGAVLEHGEEEVKEALRKSLAVGKIDLLALAKKLQDSSITLEIDLPENLQQFEIEKAKAKDYDWMLAGGKL